MKSLYYIPEDNPRVEVAVYCDICGNGYKETRAYSSIHLCPECLDCLLELRAEYLKRKEKEYEDKSGSTEE